MSLVRKYVPVVVKPVLTIIVALLLGAVIIASSGNSPATAYAVLLNGAFGSAYGVMETLCKATPLIFTGLASAIAFKAGVFNIGVEGQLYLGALAAALTGVYLGHLPSLVVIPLCFLAAMAAAVVWGMIAGVLHVKLKINIFIMFFMLNNMAILLTEYLANEPFRGEIPVPATAKVQPNALLYRFSNLSTLNVGFVIAIVLALILFFVFAKTKFGYEMDALGKNPLFARYIGIHAESKTLILLALSAMIAGMAGAEQAIGTMDRFYAGFSNDLGFTGISVALLANNNPIGVIIFAIFFGALTNGGLIMSAATSVPSDLIAMLQAILIMLISGDFVIRRIRSRKKEGKG